MARLNYKEVLKGDVGSTYVPHITDDNVLYWTNNGGLPNPTPKNIGGKTGITPNLRIGRIETLEPNQQAYANITGNSENPILNMGLPKGQEQDLKPIINTIKTVNDKLTDFTEYNFLKVETTTEINSYYDEHGNKYEFTGYNVLVAEVNPMTNYKIFASSMYQATPVTLWDEKNNFIKYMGVINNGGTSENREQIIELQTPLNCKYIKVQCTQNNYESINGIYKATYELILKKKFDGVKWGAMGDSLTDYRTLINQENKDNYVKFVSDWLGLTSDNLGEGGTGYWAGKDWEMNFPKKAEHLKSNYYDIITIFGSFNDNHISTNYTLGNIDDNTEETLYGCMNKTLENIYKSNPNAIVGIILPTPWSTWNNRYKPHSQYCKEYINAIIEFAKYNSLPYLDLFNQSNIRFWDNEFRKKYSLNNDGVHPLSDAHLKFIAPKIKNFIESLIGGK